MRRAVLIPQAFINSVKIEKKIKINKKQEPFFVRFLNPFFIWYRSIDLCIFQFEGGGKLRGGTRFESFHQLGNHFKFPQALFFADAISGNNTKPTRSHIFWLC